MKKHHYFSFLGLVGLSLFSNSIYAEPLPTSLTTTLQERERNLSHLALKWKVAFQASYAADPVSATTRKNLEKSIAQDFRKDGFTDQKVQDLTRSRLKSILETSQAHIIKKEATWDFTRDDQSTLVAGGYPVSMTILPNYREYFIGNQGLIINDPASSGPNAGKVSMTHDPYAWVSPEDSTRFPAPVDGLALLPEEFVMLAGFNPLGMYAAQWSVVSSTPDSWILEGKTDPKLPYGSMYSYLHFRMTLSRTHDNAPSDILVTEAGHPGSREWRVKSFRRYESSWIADQVEQIGHAPGIVDGQETYTLQALEPSKPIKVPVPQTQFVHDYRLLGASITPDDLTNAEIQRSHDVVYYQWPGQFPTLEELKKLRNKQHPGEGTPDPGSKTSSALPMLGGLFCIIGGVWMWRRRGAGPV